MASESMTAFVLMGVAGVGKTTLGKRLAAELSLPFIEGDDYHPRANVTKMTAGIALTDADRAPWIDAVAEAINRTSPPHVIVACSALTTFVRDRLRGRVQRPVEFFLLCADPATIEQRLRHRGAHYMRPGMLSSQLDTLQAPPDATLVDVAQPVEDSLRRLRECVSGLIHRP